MSNTDVEDAKQAPEQLLEKSETLAATRGKLVDEMLRSAITYLNGYADRTGDTRPLKGILDLHLAWAISVKESVAIAQMMYSDYQQYDALFKEVKYVMTREEMDQAIAMLRGLPSLNLTPEPADRFLILARDVTQFQHTFDFPELDRHYVFINDSLRLFAQTWHELYGKSLELMDIVYTSLEAPLPLLFRKYIELAQEVVVPLLKGLEGFVATLDLKAQ